MTTSEVLGLDIDATRASQRRIHAVRETSLLDTPPEETFDRLTRLAARAVQVPITFLSLIDERRDYYKSSFGLPEPIARGRQIEGPTISHYAMESAEPLVIDDLDTRPHWRDLPSTRQLGARAFVGIPLVTESGDVVGTFGAVDVEPRHWTSLDLELLTALAESAIREVRLRRAVRRAERSAAAAARAVRSREDVLSVVAHDLRTPLGIIANSAFLLSALPLAEPGSAALTSLRAAAGQMAALVTDLLESAEFDPGHVPLKRQPTAVDAVARDAVAMLSPIAARNGMTLAMASSDDVGQAELDYARVLRVLSNIVRNAIKRGRSGTHIELTVSGRPDVVTFRVSDNGHPMTDDEAAHAFDKMAPLESHEIHSGKFGLFIASVIVEAHGGSIAIGREDGVWNAACVTLPRMAPREIIEIGGG